MRGIDLQSLNLDGTKFSLSVPHNTPTALPIGPIPNQTPWDVLLTDAPLAPGETIVSIKWDLTGTNTPQVTVLYGTSITRTLTFAVLYKV
jgi:hypothetical protein